LASLSSEVDNSYSDFEITRACRLIQHFVIEDLSNWYIRRCRRRYWGSEQTADKATAYYYLWEALTIVCKLAAPVAPFLTEQIFINLTEPMGKDNRLSVHLEMFPLADLSLADPNLELLMENVKNIVSLGLAARKRCKIKVRQPLSMILVSFKGEWEGTKYDQLISHIKDELNVKEVRFVDNLEDLSILKVKPNFRNLGPKFGKHANHIAEILKELSSESSAKFKETGSIRLSMDGKDFPVLSDDVEFVTSYQADYEVIAEGETTVALNTEITIDLQYEGFAREIINKVQNMRKEADYNVTDKI